MDMSKAKLEKKKKEYTVPLMGLSQVGPRLKDLPNGQLPLWADLPVLNLLGELSTLETLAKLGHSRQLELFNHTM